MTEIFYFTKNPDIPPDSELLVEQALAESSDLREFLLRNDLERSVHKMRFYATRSDVL